MEWQYFFAISAYILTACDPVLGATTITNVMLADGLTPNEGRVEYDGSESNRKSICGDELSSSEASVVCRQLGYPGVNTFFDLSPFGQSTDIDQQMLNCDGDEENLADCPLFDESRCSNAGGVICYESGYTGCYTYTGLGQGDLQNLCENGLQNLTIPKCVSLCHGSNDSYTYAGLYRGDTCLCGNASTTISQADRVAERLCSSTCAGRNIERCGGESHIAMFNITSYLQNTKRNASPPECAQPTPTQTAGDVTTTVSIQSSSSSPPPPSSSPPPPSSPLSSPPPSTATPPSPSSPPPPSSPSSSPLSSPPPSTETPPSPSSPPPPPPSSPLSSPPPSTVTPPSPSSPPPPSSPSSSPSPSSPSPSPSSPRPTSPSVPSTDRTTTEGVQIGLIVVVLALLLYAVAITSLHIQFRRKVLTRTGEKGQDPYMDLQPRPEAGRTYQNMTITSSDSSQKTGERRLPSSNLVYDNQNVAQYANNMKEGADYEDVLTPN